ncbi:MAG: capsular biosynthesis protein [Candidatus Marinimicrobia bacterium]|nr:capsular biosynthesis protein [Candidatus Neomarinimicrobiota bacterium]|tara:strand:- start:393 stop:764 length:372 start_codon:yes stop_codon:yes gene_type:complete
MKSIILDLDGTLTINSSLDYSKKEINKEVLGACKKYKELGYKIVISTSRNMRTYEGNLGKINKYTLPVIIDWLEKNRVPYDEIYLGKPWCGQEGFYVDDRAIRPSEFYSLNHEQIKSLLDKEK